MVCELECKFLFGCGYDVVVVVDGMDGWNVLCLEYFDLFIIDIDMLCMDGIELVILVCCDSCLQLLLVMVVFYKDCEEDCWCGFDVGVDYYLVKVSFYDEVLLDVVVVLIGEVQG